MWFEIGICLFNDYLWPLGLSLGMSSSCKLDKRRASIPNHSFLVDKSDSIVFNDNFIISHCPVVSRSLASISISNKLDALQESIPSVLNLWPDTRILASQSNWDSNNFILPGHPSIPPLNDTLTPPSVESLSLTPFRAMPYINLLFHQFAQFPENMTDWFLLRLLRNSCVLSKRSIGIWDSLNLAILD